MRYYFVTVIHSSLSLVGVFNNFVAVFSSKIEAYALFHLEAYASPHLGKTPQTRLKYNIQLEVLPGKK